MECELYLIGENNQGHEVLSSSFQGFHQKVSSFNGMEGPTHRSDLILDIGHVSEI